MTTLLLQQMMKALTQPSKPDQAEDADQTIHEVISALTRPDAQRQIKLLLARQFGEMEKNAADFGMGNTVILTERNQRALRVLKETMAGGKKKIAIFYGAAHMPELSEKLKEMGFTQVSTDWRTAWDLTIRADQPSAVEKLLNSLFDAADGDGN
jgi:DNA-binding MarR family transcriptional regulator